MGFFDFLSSLFGGGAKMALSLVSDRVPEGGILSGTATLTGAPKDVTVTDIKVKLLYVHVEQQEDSPMPKIDTRVLIDQTIATNVELPSGEEKTFDFTLTIPPGTEPTAHNVSYTVMVTADIPSMKDPSAKTDLTVVEGSGEGDEPGLTADKLFARWPALRGTEEQPLRDALRDMRWKHREGDAENDLTVAEPILQKLMKSHDSAEVRKTAFEVWAGIVSEHLRTEHVALMGEVLESAQGDDETLRAVLGAMGPTMDMGGDKLAIPYLQHESPKVRLAAVNALDWGRGNTVRRDALLAAADGESDREVRGKLVNALGDYKDHPPVLEKIIEIVSNEDTSEVVKESLSALALVWTQDGDGWERVAPLYAKARNHKDPEVRKAYVNWIRWPAMKTDQSAAIQELLQDSDDAVAEAMAFEFCNLLRDKKLPQHAAYCELCKATITGGRSDKIKSRALGALDEFMEPAEVAGVYREILAGGETSQDLQWGMVQGIKFTTSPELKQVLLEMSESEYSRVARAAKDAYESDYS